jgi:methionyl-tRNA synthetase
VELPFDKDYVCYVWFDALINYISAIGYLSDNDTFEKWWPAVHLIGKDILTTHAVYWPCMLEAMGLPQPKTIFAHGWWLSGETKMSKSLGNVIKPLELADKYGIDGFRYFLMREMTLGQDSTYSEDLFIKRYNSDLANDLGNLLSRVIKMVKSYCGGKIPEISVSDSTDDSLKTEADKLIGSIDKKINGYKLNQAVENILELVRSTNRYIEQNKPWVLAKDENTDRLNSVLYNAAESLRIVSILLSPVMPEKCAIIQNQLGLSEPGKLIWGDLKKGTSINPGDGLFPRLSKPKVSGDKEKVPNEMPDGIIEFDQFAKVKFKTANIIEAVKVKNAEKLLKLQIDLDGEKRQIVAGIAEYYKPEDLTGKTIIVVTNLKPVKIRGIESNGMLLAARKGKKLVLLTTDNEIPPGASIS